MQGTIRYTGTAPTSVLVLGDGGPLRNAEKLYTGLNGIRQTLSDWSSKADIGITVRNFDASQIELRRVEGFTIGMRTLGDGRGVEDSGALQPAWRSRVPKPPASSAAELMAVMVSMASIPAWGAADARRPEPPGAWVASGCVVRNVLRRGRHLLHRRLLLRHGIRPALLEGVEGVHDHRAGAIR
jgi:hypothetical protein